MTSGIVQFEQRQDFLGDPTDGWYWRDDACEEWMGPFATLDEARADHRTLRQTCAACGYGGDNCTCNPESA